MPYKCANIKLKGLQDRRKKLSDEQKLKIEKLYSLGNTSLNKLAREYNVSKSTVLLIVNKESKAKKQEYIKNHWRNYQLKGEERNKVMTEHRHYKQNLYLKGELI